MSSPKKRSRTDSSERFEPSKKRKDLSSTKNSSKKSSSKISSSKNSSRRHEESNNNGKTSSRKDKSNRVTPSKYEKSGNSSKKVKRDKKGRHKSSSKKNRESRKNGHVRESEDDEELVPPSLFLRAEKVDSRMGESCPFLDSINRRVLDFDFEKVCSVTMTNHNVYCCLVCGVYYNGRAKGSPAYYHALHENHRVFIHLGNSRIYCLPEGYEVHEKSLGDIQHNLHPKFTKEEIQNIDHLTEYSHALDGNDYLPGVIGLNNLSGTDAINSVMQSFMRIVPLRNYFIEESNVTSSSLLLSTFGELIRKYFNPRNFKGHVSPHEILQVISIMSNKQFDIGKGTDPFNFTAWFIKTLHEEFGTKESIITKCFQGQVREEIKIPLGMDADGEELYELKTKNKPFLWLNLPLPPIPLFKDGQQEKFIPQVPITDILAKKFGSDSEEAPWVPQKDNSYKRHILTKLPKYLIMIFKRFHENNFFIEKNNTIVNFVIKNLDLRQYMERRISTEYLSTMGSKKLKATLVRFGGDPRRFSDKVELIKQIGDLSEERKLKGRYDLLANVCTQGKFLKGESHVYLLNRPNNQWYKIMDLHAQEILPNLVSVSEAYLQFWERRD